MDVFHMSPLDFGNHALLRCGAILSQLNFPQTYDDSCEKKYLKSFLIFFCKLATIMQYGRQIIPFLFNTQVDQMKFSIKCDASTLGKAKNRQ